MIKSLFRINIILILNKTNNRKGRGIDNMNELTLEEVIDKMDNYLTEAGAIRKYLTDEGQEYYDKHNEKAKQSMVQSKDQIKKLDKEETDIKKKLEVLSRLSSLNYR